MQMDGGGTFLNGSFFANFCKIKMSPRGMIEEEWVDIKIGNMQFAKKCY